MRLIVLKNYNTQSYKVFINNKYIYYIMMYIYKIIVINSKFEMLKNETRSFLTFMVKLLYIIYFKLNKITISYLFILC